MKQQGTKRQTLDGKIEKVNKLIGQGVIRIIMADKCGLTSMLQHTHKYAHTDTHGTQCLPLF